MNVTELKEMEAGVRRFHIEVSPSGKAMHTWHKLTPKERGRLGGLARWRKKRLEQQHQVQPAANAQHPDSP